MTKQGELLKRCTAELIPGMREWKFIRLLVHKTLQAIYKSMGCIYAEIRQLSREEFKL